MSLRESDRKHLLHPFTLIQEHEDFGPHIFERGEGIEIFDTEGKAYIDAMAGLWCVNVGYGRSEIGRAMADQVDKLCFYHAFMSASNEPAIRLSEKLAALAPGNLNHVFFCNSGSEANDTHIKMIRYYNNLRGNPKKKKILSRTAGYHGATIATANLGGLPHLHNGFDLPNDTVIRLRKPHAYWEAPAESSEEEFSQQLARELEDVIAREGAESIAAFIAEPVMAAGGVVPPPKGYFDLIVPILKENDILFIADEVVCGFGRLGAMFGSNTYGIEPDLMTLAKGLTSGYVPMSACLVSDTIYEVLKTGSPEMGPFAHGYTYSGHPVSAAAALANIAILEEEQLVQNAAEVGAHFQTTLRDAVADHSLVGEVRGLGLIAGVELVADKQARTPFDPSAGVARKLYNQLLREQLICRPIGNALTFSPPLIVTREDCDTIVARFARGLERFAKDLAT